MSCPHAVASRSGQRSNLASLPSLYTVDLRWCSSARKTDMATHRCVRSSKRLSWSTNFSFVSSHDLTLAFGFDPTPSGRCNSGNSSLFATADASAACAVSFSLPLGSTTGSEVAVELVDEGCSDCLWELVEMRRGQLGRRGLLRVA